MFKILTSREYSSIAWTFRRGVTAEELSNLSQLDRVEIAIEGTNGDRELTWVRILRRIGSSLLGIVGNKPQMVVPVDKGTVVSFGTEHVIDFIKHRKEDVDPAPVPLSGSELEEKHKRDADIAFLIAGVYGFNQLASEAETLGEKLYYRLMREELIKHFTDAGGKIDVTREPAVLMMEGWRPYMNLTVSDEAQMRKYIQDQDINKLVPIDPAMGSKELISAMAGRIDSVLSDTTARIRAVGAEYREKVLIHFCRDYHLDFSAGWFYRYGDPHDEDHAIIDSEQVSPKDDVFPEILTVWEVINQDVTDGMDFSQNIDPISYEEIK